MTTGATEKRSYSTVGGGGESGGSMTDGAAAYDGAERLELVQFTLEQKKELKSTWQIIYSKVRTTMQGIING